MSYEIEDEYIGKVDNDDESKYKSCQVVDEIILASTLYETNLERVKLLVYLLLKKNNIIHTTQYASPVETAKDVLLDEIMSNSFISLPCTYLLNIWEILITFSTNPKNNDIQVTFQLVPFRRRTYNGKCLFLDLSAKEMECFSRDSIENIVQCEKIYEKIDRVIRTQLREINNKAAIRSKSKMWNKI